MKPYEGPMFFVLLAAGVVMTIIVIVGMTLFLRMALRDEAKRKAARDRARGGPGGAVLLALLAPATLARAHDQLPVAPPGAIADALANASPPWFESRAFTAPSRRQKLAALESVALGAVDAASLRRSHDALASEPHVAGTDGGMRGAARLAALFAEAGLAVETPEYHVLLPSPIGAELEIVSPERLALSVREDALPEDPFTRDDLALGWNGYSGSGEATGEVVYANYGTKADFDALRAMGVSCQGRIVIARYGGNFRGYKAKYAQEAGAAGIIIYTDPADSGFAQGLGYPEGVWANASSIQRGSVDTLPYDGDPLTPFVAATRDAPRLKIEEVSLPKIPVQPVGWRTAHEILSRMKGPAVQESAPGAAAPAPAPGKAWQGGLPFTYRLTGGPDLRVRLKVEQRLEVRPIRNVVARLEGARFPDQVVIVGAHHDAWVHGADDPLSGTIVVVEAARALAAAAKAGHRPARTILFCGWDAEEFGIIGSAEWVEDNADMLARGAVAYINLDAAVSGRNFSSSASPSLQSVIREATKGVAQPIAPGAPAINDPARSIFDTWRERTVDRAGAPATLPTIGTLGGGSDHAPFLTHLCIPSAGMSMGGAPGTAYHSMYDTLTWYRKMMRDDYEPHAALARIVTLVLARLANADAIPYDLRLIPSEVARHLASLAERAGKAKFPLDAEHPLDVAKQLEFMAGRTFGLVCNAAENEASDERLARLNRALIGVERAWLHAPGLPERPWRRNLFVAPDETSGYASWPLPGLRRAVERADAPELGVARVNLLDAFSRLRDAMDAVAVIALETPETPAPSGGSAGSPSVTPGRAP